MLKKSLSFIIAIAAIFGCFCLCFFSASAATDIEKELASLMESFPHGKYWNHVGSDVNDINSVTDEPCPCHDEYACDYFGKCSCNSYKNAIQCMGYANMISSKITGADVSTYKKVYSLNVAELRVGDIIRASGHSVCVTGVNGDKISITDCNYGDDCIIRWRTVDKSWFRYVEYVQHLSTNKRTNKNVDFHDAYKNAEVSGNLGANEERKENWTSSSKYITVRKSADASAEAVGKIPADKSFVVYEKVSDGKNLWGKVEYKKIKGYAVLDDAYYNDGRYQSPDFKTFPYLHNLDNVVKLSWNSVSGATNYRVYLRNVDSGFGSIVVETKKTSCTLENLEEGIYEARIYAENSLSGSWSIRGGAATFKVSKIIIKPEKVEIKKSITLDIDKSSTLKPAFTPATTTNQKVSWKSSDTKVATVDSNGAVKAITPGKAVITCTSKDNSKIKATCEVTVRPAAVNLVQIKSGTTSSSVGLSWGKSKGASGYTVYSYDEKNKKLQKITSTSKTKYTVKKLKASAEYIFVVRSYAKTASGNIESSYIKLCTATSPVTVTDLRQTGSGTGKLKLKWKNQKIADYYIIYVYDKNKKKYVKLATSKSNSYTVEGKSSVSNKYSVAAVVEVSDGIIKGKISEPVKGVTGLAVPKVTITSTKSSVKITWTKVPRATGYTVYKLVDGKKVLVKSFASDITSYTVKNLKSNKNYTYYVRAERAYNKTLTLYSDYVSASIKTKK